MPGVGQVADEIGDPRVALGEDGGVVVVAVPGVLEHALQVADESGRSEIPSAGGDGGLMHMQCEGQGRSDLANVHARVRRERRSSCRRGVRDDAILAAAQVWQTIDERRAG